MTDASSHNLLSRPVTTTTTLALSEVISGAVQTSEESLMCLVDRQSNTPFWRITSLASGGVYSERGIASLDGLVGLRV